MAGEHRSWFSTSNVERAVKNALHLLEAEPYMPFDAALDHANLIKKHLNDALAWLDADVFAAMKEHAGPKEPK